MDLPRPDRGRKVYLISRPVDNRRNEMEIIEKMTKTPKQCWAPILKNILIGLVLSVCIAGFVWICYAQVVNFLSETTSISTTWIKGGSHIKFPTMVFCSTMGFKAGSKTAYVSKETYDNISTPVDVKLTGILKGSGERCLGENSDILLSLTKNL
jgi:hypothetical protein